MKFIYLIYVFWINVVSIQGIPNNFEHRIQPRGIGDLPVISWFYGSNPNESPQEETINSGDDINDNDEIKVIPLNKMGSNDEPEPIENFFKELKEKEINTNGKDEKIMTLLTDLKKTMTQSSANVAKVFVNKAWHVFDIGGLGTSRRTRNVQEMNYLMASFYAILSLLSQMIFFGTYSNNATPVNQKILGAVAGLPAPQNSSDDSNINYIIVIDDKNKEAVNRLWSGKTFKDVLLKIKEYLDKDNLSDKQKFYIVWKLYNLFSDLFDNDDQNILKLITLIIEIGEDPRFEELFKIFKTKKDPKFGEMWKLFKKSKPMLHKKYLTTVKNFPDEKVEDFSSRDCFMIGPAQGIAKSEKGKEKEDGRDDEKNKLATRDLESLNNYYIFCNDDDNESEANSFFEGDSNDKIILKIKQYLEKDYLDPKTAWYIILKSYKMFENLSKDDKERSKIIQLIILIGKDPKFQQIFENFKSKKDPRLQDIWKSFKNNPKDLEENNKSPPKIEPDHKHDPKNEISKHSSPLLKNNPEDEKIFKDEKEPKKDTKNNPTETRRSTLNPQSSDFTKRRVDRKKKHQSYFDEIHRIVCFKLEIETEDKNFNNPLSENINSLLITYYNRKTEILYSDLEEVESLLKDPSSNLLTRNDIINFVHKWYNGLGPKYIEDEKIKHKLDELVQIIKKNQEYKNFFESLSTPSGRVESQQTGQKITISPSPIQMDLSSGAVLDSVILHIEKILKNPAINPKSVDSLIHLTYSLSHIDHLTEPRKRKIDEIINLIKRTPEYNRIFESKRQTS